jgi:transcriptional regulator with XRE-family HTH domain
MDAITRGTPLKSIAVDDLKVRLFLEAFGVSLRELARRMGCDHAYLLRVLRQKQQISARYATRLVEVLQEIARTNPLSPFAFMRELPAAQAPAAAAPAAAAPAAAAPPTPMPPLQALPPTEAVA